MKKTMKKTKCSLIVIYCLAVFFLFLPFLKQACLIHQTRSIKIHQVTAIEDLDSVELNAVQPPSLTDALRFDQNQVFRSIGRLVIPDVKISLPVFAGLLEDEMLVGVGTLYPERLAEKENIVIFGHHLGRKELLLGQILSLTEGKSIYLTYFGINYTYRITNIKTVDEKDLTVLSNHQKAEITLITCDTASPTNKRFVVTGEQQHAFQNQEAQTRKKQAEQIEQKQQEKNGYYVYFIFLMFLVVLISGIFILYKFIS